MTTTMRPLFRTGSIYITPGAKAMIPHEEVMSALYRHVAGDFGDLCEDDNQANLDAIMHGDRILSAYNTEDGERFWIITEYDRSATTILLPEEY